MPFGNPMKALSEVKEAPKNAAKGFALGVFFAMTPLVCVKLLLVILIASILRWNRTAATIGVLVANPITVPIIFSSSYFIGASLLGMDLALDIQSVFSQHGITELLAESKEIIVAMLLGGGLLGLVAAAGAYLVSLMLLRKQQEQQTELLTDAVLADHPAIS